MEYLARHDTKDAGLRRFMGRPTQSGKVSCPVRGCSVVYSDVGQMTEHQTTVKHSRWNKNMPPLDVPTVLEQWSLWKGLFKWGVLYKHQWHSFFKGKKKDKFINLKRECIPVFFYNVIEATGIEFYISNDTFLVKSQGTSCRPYKNQTKWYAMIT